MIMRFHSRQNPVLLSRSRGAARRTFLSARAILAALGVAALGLAGGCTTTGALIDPIEIGPFFEAKNFTGVPRLPAKLQRVVLLPVAGAPGVPNEAMASFDQVVLAELQHAARFEVVVADPIALNRLFDRPRLLSSEALPQNFLSLLSREYGADGVMFVDITSLYSYQPLVIGLRAKLATTSGTILWAFDTLFSAGNPAVANSARRHDRQRQPATNPGDMSYTVLRSPMRFADYAAATAFATLPPR
jgi:hypothetical protein